MNLTQRLIKLEYVTRSRIRQMQEYKKKKEFLIKPQNNNKNKKVNKLAKYSNTSMSLIPFIVESNSKNNNNK